KTRGIRMLVATESLPGDLLAARELEIGDVGIGSLLIVAEAVAAPGRDNRGGELHIQPPPAQVQGVDAIITELAIPPVPDPVRVVMDAIVVIGLARGRPLPQLIVECRRRGGLFA